MGTSLYNLVKEKGCLVWVVIIIILISVSASAQQPKDSLPAIDTASLTNEDPQEFFEWVDNHFDRLPKKWNKKLWIEIGTGKFFTIRQLYNKFVYTKNECWWDDEEAIKHTKEIRKNNKP